MVSSNIAPHTVSHPPAYEASGPTVSPWDGLGDAAPDPWMSWRFRSAAPCPVDAPMCPSARVPGRTTANPLPQSSPSGSIHSSPCSLIAECSQKPVLWSQLTLCEVRYLLSSTGGGRCTKRMGRGALSSPARSRFRCGLQSEAILGPARLLCSMPWTAHPVPDFGSRSMLSAIVGSVFRFVGAVRLSQRHRDCQVSHKIGTRVGPKYIHGVPATGCHPPRHRWPIARRCLYQSSSEPLPRASRTQSSTHADRLPNSRDAEHAQSHQCPSPHIKGIIAPSQRLVLAEMRKTRGRVR